MRVTWIGMGQIGRPMALRTLAAGHGLVGHTRRPADYEDVRAAGGSLTSDARAAMEAGAILAVHSTVSPEGMRALAEARADLRVIDAAFSGTAQDAAERRIALMVGGDADALRDAEPVLSAYADHIAHVGPLGSGMTLKLLNNMLFAAQIGLAYDALAAAQASGIALDDAVKVIGRSSGGSYAMRLFAGAPDVDAVMQGVGRYMKKDVAVAREAAAGVDIGGLSQATDRFLPS